MNNPCTFVYSLSVILLEGRWGGGHGMASARAPVKGLGGRAALP